MKVEARIHYSDGNVRFANVENLRWYMHRSDAIGRFMNTTYGQSQDKTNVKVWTDRDVLYFLLAEYTVGPNHFSSHNFSKIQKTYIKKIIRKRPTSKFGQTETGFRIVYWYESMISIFLGICCFFNLASKLFGPIVQRASECYQQDQL